MSRGNEGLLCSRRSRHPLGTLCLPSLVVWPPLGVSLPQEAELGEGRPQPQPHSHSLQARPAPPGGMEIRVQTLLPAGGKAQEERLALSAVCADSQLIPSLPGLSHRVDVGERMVGGEYLLHSSESLSKAGKNRARGRVVCGTQCPRSRPASPQAPGTAHLWVSGAGYA